MACAGGHGVSNVVSLHRTSTSPQPDRIVQRGRIAWRAPNCVRVVARRWAATGGSRGPAVWDRRDDMGVGVMAGAARDLRNRLGRTLGRMGSRLRLARALAVI